MRLAARRGSWEVKAEARATTTTQASVSAGLVPIKPALPIRFHLVDFPKVHPKQTRQEK